MVVRVSICFSIRSIRSNMAFSRASLAISLSVTESLSLISPPCALLPPVSIAFHLLHSSSCYQQKLFAQLPTVGAKMLMRDSGSPRSTTRVSARSTSPRPGSLLVKLLLQRFLRTQTSQSTPVVFPAQTLRRSSQI